MGTNYYFHPGPACECCGRAPQATHIGKSSAGWNFAVHVLPAQGINSLDDWRKMFTRPGSYILDEYGTKITEEEMLLIITNRTHKLGLQRSGIDGWHCVGHGEGTWDYFAGDFS